MVLWNYGQWCGHPRCYTPFLSVIAISRLFTTSSIFYFSHPPPPWLTFTSTTHQWLISSQISLFITCYSFKLYSRPVPDHYWWSLHMTLYLHPVCYPLCNGAYTHVQDNKGGGSFDELWLNGDGTKYRCTDVGDVFLCITYKISWGINPSYLFGIDIGSCHDLLQPPRWYEHNTITLLDLLWGISVITLGIFPQHFWAYCNS